MAKTSKESMNIIKVAHEASFCILPRNVFAKDVWKDKINSAIEIIRRINAAGDACKKNNQSTFFPSVWYPCLASIWGADVLLSMFFQPGNHDLNMLQATSNKRIIYKTTKCQVGNVKKLATDKITSPAVICLKIQESFPKQNL